VKSELIAALSIATAAALSLAAVANACGGGGDVPSDYDFVSPSGNIACAIYADGSGAIAKSRTTPGWLPRPQLARTAERATSTSEVLEIYVSQGKPANLGCYEGASSSIDPASRHSTTARNTRAARSLAKVSRPALTCTDTATGHFFRISRESYELGEQPTRQTVSGGHVRARAFDDFHLRIRSALQTTFQALGEP